MLRNDLLLPRCPHFRYRYHPASMRQPQLLRRPLLPPPTKMTHDPSIHWFGGDTRTSYSGSENTMYEWLSVTFLPPAVFPLLNWFFPPWFESYQERKQKCLRFFCFRTFWIFSIFFKKCRTCRKVQQGSAGSARIKRYCPKPMFWGFWPLTRLCWCLP